MIKTKPSKTNRIQRKRKRVQKISKNLKDISDDDEPMSISNEKTANKNKQKYFIMVEETSSKGKTENLIFLVEENPTHVYPETRKSGKKSNKRSKSELTNARSIESVVHSNKLLDDNLPKEKQLSGSNLDTEKLPSQVNILIFDPISLK